MKTLAALLTISALAADLPQYDKSGKLEKPANYREWVYLTTGYGMTYAQENRGTPMFDNVFVEPSAYGEFLKTGKWPDKTMFALEIRTAEANGSINTGTTGRFQTAVRAVEFAVKDVKRFPNEWAYFGFRPDVTSAEPFPESAGCQACHSKNGAVEQTFVQFYPTLFGVAKAKGTLRESYLKADNPVPH
jgi:hypothetical protein